MDYEFRIKLAEQELAHLREMHAISLKRQDVTDQRLDLLQEITKSLAISVQSLATTVDTLAVKVDALVSALLREHPNGREQQ